MVQLPTDCLNDIFEYLEDDMTTLHSCLLVNRLWCIVSVEIFWRDTRNYSTSNFKTLISCLPKKSKEILYKNKNKISIPTFNYASFCKILSINRVHYKIKDLLDDQKSNGIANVVTQEICKMFMNQTSSLKGLIFFSDSIEIYNSSMFYSETKDCLKNLSELHCNSIISSEIFYLLSHLCHNIILIEIVTGNILNNGLEDLIIVQKYLKSFIITQYGSKKDIFSFLITKLPNTIINLNIRRYNNIPLSFISKFSKLQELELSLDYNNNFIEFEKLQNSTFSELQILKIRGVFPEWELLINFLENNGKNLRELYLGDYYGISDNYLNLAVAKFCPNLSKVSVGFRNNELETFKIVLNNCQYLESINIWCEDGFLDERTTIEAIVEYSKNIYEIILYHPTCARSTLHKLCPDELEYVLTIWADREPNKPLSLVIYNTKDENIMKIIKKYIKLGVIKEFKVKNYDNELTIEDLKVS